MENENAISKLKAENPGYLVSEGKSVVTVVDGQVNIEIGENVFIRMSPKDAQKFAVQVLKKAYLADGQEITQIVAL